MTLKGYFQPTFYYNSMLFVNPGYICTQRTASSSTGHLSVSVTQGKIIWHCVPYNLASLIMNIFCYFMLYTTREIVPLTYLTSLSTSSGSRTVIMCGTPYPFTSESTSKNLLTPLILPFMPLTETQTVTWTSASTRGSGINSSCWRQQTAGYGANEILLFLHRKRPSRPRYQLYFQKNHTETER